MRYTIVVVAYRSRESLTRFLDGLGGRVPVVIVDNSADEDEATLTGQRTLKQITQLGLFALSSDDERGFRRERHQRSPLGSSSAFVHREYSMGRGMSDSSTLT